MRIAIFFIILLSGVAQANDLDDVSSLKQKIEAGLTAGVSKKEVESLLKYRKWLYAYDRIQHRFQATPPSGTSECKGRNLLLWAFYDCEIQIFINLSESGKYHDFSVEQIYSGL
jgi:hypothetical protein